MAEPSVLHRARSGLTERLGYEFRHPGLLDRALTHSSSAGPASADNERLEFLGDRVLALLVTEALIERFPKASEGDLAPRLNALVRKETCARVARQAGLDRQVRLSRSEEETGGRSKTNILADVCEAVIGALYLDGGLDAARRFVALYWTPLYPEVAATPRDAKTALQEWAQGRGLGMPTYELVARSGPDHAPSFRIAASVPGSRAEGGGPSKRAAEQAAARALLIAEKVWTAE